MSASSHCCGVGQEAGVRRSDRESSLAVPNYPTCSLMALSADFRFVELLLRINRLYVQGTYCAFKTF